jgi:biopolymer transport protein ExbD
MARSRPASKIEVPMSSMIDITFLLLMYFIVTAKPTLVEAHMAINLPAPSKSSAPSDVPPQLFEVHVKPNNQYLLMGTTPADLDSLRNAMVTVASLDPDTTVIIKVDPQARERTLMELLDLCAEVHMTKLNVLTLR